MTTPTQPSSCPPPSADFHVLRWTLEWLILPDTTSLIRDEVATELLIAKTLPFEYPPIKWDYVGWPEATGLRTFKLSSKLKEEVKSCIRKVSGVKGNRKELFFVYKEQEIDFTVFVITYHDGSFALYLRSSPQITPVSTSDLVRLSSQPAQKDSLLDRAIQKVFATLYHGDINSRPAERLNFNWYPYIHITDYCPRFDKKFPWHELAQIGTRHTNISIADEKFIEAYKEKNASLREEVLVVDKQSTLVVSSEDHLELQGIRLCLAVALRMRQVLEQQFYARNMTVDPHLMERLRFTFHQPSVITNSYNFQTLWPLIMGECQVVKWLDNIKNDPSKYASATTVTVPACTSNEVTESKAITISAPKEIEWLHLSDLHFRESYNSSRNNVLDALIDDLKDNLQAGWKPDFIAITGDIAFSGEKEQYKVAWQFFRRLIKLCNLTPSKLYTVPGNHDIKRSEHRASLLKSLREAKTQEEYVTVCRELGGREVQKLLNARFSSYRSFTENFPKRRWMTDEKLWYVDKVRGAGQATAGIAGLTSSWASGEDGEDGSRYLAIGQFQARPAAEALRKMDTDIKLVFLHHPLDALQRQDEISFLKEFRGTCNIILRGHLHATDIRVTSDPDGGIAALAAGSAFETEWANNGYLLNKATVTDSLITIKVQARRWMEGGFFGADTATYHQGRNDGIFEVKIER